MAQHAPLSPVPADNLSYIEHIFEISRRPDLLTMVVQYRTQVLKISEEDEVDTKLTRIPSAKKYKGEPPPAPPGNRAPPHPQGRDPQGWVAIALAGGGTTQARRGPH